MTRRNILIAMTCILAVGVSGCVERRLTVNTEPQGAVVLLNDEEIGTSPVTVSFQWYGDYNIAISKDGFETLKTHRSLQAPWYDAFPFDFFAQLVIPRRVVDSYEWTFELVQKQPLTRDQLLEKVEKIKSQVE